MNPEYFIKKWNDNPDDPIFKTKKGKQVAKAIKELVETYKSLKIVREI